MKIQQVRPRFVDSTQPLLTVEISSIEELVNIDWISRWKNGFDEHPFYRYARDDKYILGEFSGGEFWWVIAKIVEDDTNITLPLPTYMGNRIKAT